MTTLVFEAGYDIADLGGFAANVVETGGNTFSISIATGAYFLTQDGSAASGDFSELVASYEPLLDAIVAALNAGGASAGYSASMSVANERITITHSGSGGVTAVSLTPTSNGGLIGFTGAVSGSLSLTGQRVPDYWIQSEIGYWSSWSGEYDGGGDVAYDVEAHDGRPGGAAKDDAPTYLDFELPLEPVAKVGNYPARVSASAPWTWRDLWTHCRNVEPVAMDDGTDAYFLLLRAEGAKFKPKARGDNYVAEWDLAFKTRVLARG